MAKYLSNIDLNKNQLQNAVIHPLGTAPGTPSEGQIYYDSTVGDKKIYLYNGSAWVALAVGDHTTDYVSGVTLVGTDLTFTGVGNAFSGTVDLSSLDELVNDSTITIAAGTYLSTGGSFTLNQATPATITLDHDTTTRTDTTSTDSPVFGGSFEAVTSVTTNTTGHITAIDVSTVTIPAFPTITLEGEVTGSGTTSISTTVANNVLDVANFNASAIVTVAEGIENNDNDTTLPTSAAVKAYVDSSVAGGLIYQGGYNAATNTPNLDSTPIAGIKKGWTYTVTADGLFFAEQVRVGDVIIAEIDSPTTLADWTTVQNNIDLASLTQVGIGNVNAGTGIDVSYASGTATVSLTATPTRSGSIAVPNSATYTYPNGITSLAGTNSVLIQLVDSNGETVYADVQRLTATTFSVNYGVATPTGVVALIQLIG